MPVTGVRSSWEARRTNSLRTRSKARCSVTSRTTSTAPTLCPPGWVTGYSDQASRRDSPATSTTRSGIASSWTSPSRAFSTASWTSTSLSISSIRLPWGSLETNSWRIATGLACSMRPWLSKITRPSSMLSSTACRRRSPESTSSTLVLRYCRRASAIRPKRRVNWPTSATLVIGRVTSKSPSPILSAARARVSIGAPKRRAMLWAVTKPISRMATPTRPSRPATR